MIVKKTIGKNVVVFSSTIYSYIKYKNLEDFLSKFLTQHRVAFVVSPPFPPLLNRHCQLKGKSRVKLGSGFAVGSWDQLPNVNVIM